MKKHLLALATAIALFGSLVSPAAAATHSGHIDCSAGGARIGVRGEMQRLRGYLTLRINGRVVYHKSNSYVGYGSSYSRRANWSANAQTLLFSGSYGYCIPPA